MTTSTCNTHPAETVRPATEREMAANGFGPSGEFRCCWCLTDADEQTVYGIRLPDGQMAWSPSYCGEGCHAEAVGNFFNRSDAR